MIRKNGSRARKSSMFSVNRRSSGRRMRARDTNHDPMIPQHVRAQARAGRPQHLQRLPVLRSTVVRTPTPRSAHRRRGSAPYSSVLFPFALVFHGEERQFAWAVVVQVVEDVFITGEGEMPSFTGSVDNAAGGAIV